MSGALYGCLTVTGRENLLPLAAAMSHVFGGMAWPILTNKAGTLGLVAPNAGAMPLNPVPKLLPWGPPCSI